MLRWHVNTPAHICDFYFEKCVSMTTLVVPRFFSKCDSLFLGVLSVDHACALHLTNSGITALEE